MASETRAAGSAPSLNHGQSIPTSVPSSGSGLTYQAALAGGGEKLCAPPDTRSREDHLEFLALARTIPAILFIHQNGRFRYVNPAAETILGYAQAELLKMD